MAPRAGLLVSVVSLLSVSLLAGCAPGGPGEIEGDTLSVYFGLPLRGESAPRGEAIRDGARLALAEARDRAGEVRLRPVFLDDTEGPARGARWSPVAVAADARRAAQDTTAIAYVGDLDSGATRTSLPITNQAMMLQVSPGSTAVGLARTGPAAGDAVPELVQPTGQRTFGRVIPDDATQAEAGAVWARRLGARRAAVISDGSEFGGVVAGEFVDQAEAEGVSIAADERRRPAGAAVADVRRARPDLVYYGGTAEGALPLLARVASAAPRATMMATDALLEPSFLNRAGRLASRLRITASAEDPRQLPAPGQRFLRAYRNRFHRAANPYAAYGFEATAVVIDSIERAGDRAEDRGAVIDAFFDTSDRHSILGRYSIDEVGNTTLKAFAGYRFSAGRPVFVTPLRAP